MKKLLFILLFFVSATMPLVAQEAQKPNIVIILADDLGYADVGFHGSDIQTPNLDKLAEQGVRLENFRSCPMCSPTRAGLMTGRYPIRFGMMRAVVPPHRNYGLDPNEQTIPEMLAEAGYKYRGIFGKWHLGHLQTKWHPNYQGFTDFVGCYNGAVDYFTRERGGEVDWHHNAVTVKTEGYTTDLISDAAVNFIKAVPKKQPYFLYVPYTAPHSPFQAKESDISKYKKRKNKKRQIYAAMVDCMDQGIGRILKTIDQRGDRDNTFVLFFSDNGGVKNVADNSPMKGHKLTVYEGGIRVVAAAHWPDGGIIGGKEIHELMGYIDVFPTLKAMAGNSNPNKNTLDGMNVLEAMQGEAKLPKRSWFTYFDQDTKSNHAGIALNYGAQKLIIEEKQESSNRITLYNIDKSYYESQSNEPHAKIISDDMFKIVTNYMGLKIDEQIEKFIVGKEGFVAPKDWVILNE